MKNENDTLLMKKIKDDLGYRRVGDRPSHRKTFSTKILPELVDEIQNKIFDEFDLEVQGFQKIIILSNIIDIYKRIEVLFG